MIPVLGGIDAQVETSISALITRMSPTPMTIENGGYLTHPNKRKGFAPARAFN